MLTRTTKALLLDVHACISKCVGLKEVCYDRRWVKQGALKWIKPDCNMVLICDINKTDSQIFYHTV